MNHEMSATTQTGWLASDLFADHEELLNTPAIHRGPVGQYLSPFYRLGRLYRARIGGRRALRRSALLIPEMVRQVGRSTGPTGIPAWSVLRSAWSITDVAVFVLGSSDGTPRAIAKAPHTPEGMAHLRRQREILETLQVDDRLGTFRRLIPMVLAGGMVGPQFYLVESVLPGTELRSVQRDSSAYPRGLHAAATCIARLHRHTAHQILVGEAEVERWIEAPLRLLEGLFCLLPRSARIEGVETELRHELRDALLGREVAASWIHGDLWPGNVLVSDDGATVHGIVDWGRAARDDLPLHDLMQLTMHSPRLVGSHGDLGAIVAALLRRPDLEPAEWALLDGAMAPWPVDASALRRMILLYWLRYLATYLVKCPDNVRNQWWVRRNVADVFREV